MRGDTTAAQLLAVTVRLRSEGATGCSEGTGFIYEVRVRGRARRIYLVSTRHQLEHAAGRLRISMLRRGLRGGPAWGNELVVDLASRAPRWYGHPDQDLDVAVLPLEGVIPPADLFGLSADVAMTAELEESLDAIEEVLTVGYPHALYDETNGTPIVRRGVTATPVGLDYCGEPAFMIDAATFQGSSGSPVMLLVEPGPSGPGPHAVLGRSLVFAGMVKELHQQRLVGDVRRVEAKTALEFSTRGAMHLGIVLKARVIDECIDHALALEGLKRHAEVDRAGAASAASFGRSTSARPS